MNTSPVTRQIQEPRAKGQSQSQSQGAASGSHVVMFISQMTKLPYLLQIRHRRQRNYCWEKMICRILLFISLTSCVCATCVVDVTKTSYQAEENKNITLEWMFSTTPNSSSTSLNITCNLIDVKYPVLYHLRDGVEVSESQDVKFAGRVQCDKDALREGHIKLHVFRLRTDDSGLYRCTVGPDDKKNTTRCRLNVTAAFDQPKPQPESQGRIGLYVGLTAAVLLAVCAGLYFAFRLRSNPDERR
ncbi:uncharacterized protein [Thunnus thynnus]|uniref:uncharacterized protein isoform X2 n=1 Tax=Thunnus thynnus TaxID=8237 RepID=UPI00352740FE